jgi:2-keto-4-pentenoate hydratase
VIGPAETAVEDFTVGGIVADASVVGMEVGVVAGRIDTIVGVGSPVTGMIVVRSHATRNRTMQISRITQKRVALQFIVSLLSVIQTGIVPEWH